MSFAFAFGFYTFVACVFETVPASIPVSRSAPVVPKRRQWLSWMDFFFFFVSFYFYFSEFGSFTCAEFWHLRSKTIDFRICGYGHHATQLFIATYIRVVVVSFEHVLGASHLVWRRVVLVAVYYNTNKISFYFYFIHFRLLCAQVFFVSSKS